MESIARAPGFRFYPTEEELVAFYLHHKLEGTTHDLIRAMDSLIPLLDVFHCNPWDLPQLAGEVCRGDQEQQWLFFNPIQEKEIEGGRPSRHNATGYWKSTGSPSYVYSSDNRCIGLKRTMVFYSGRVRNGNKTDWRINQYKAIQSQHSSSTASNRMIRQELSVCRLYKTPKCRRSFDRRPMGSYAAEPSLTLNPQHTQIQEEEEDEERTTPQNPIMADPTITPPNYSLSTSQVVNNEPLWDWEHLWYSWDCDMYGFGF